MARATNIWLVGPDLDGSTYAFTVKHEAQSFIRRNCGGWVKNAHVQRVPDGGNGPGASPTRRFTIEEFLNG